MNSKDFLCRAYRDSDMKTSDIYITAINLPFDAMIQYTK